MSPLPLPSPSPAVVAPGPPDSSFDPSEGFDPPADLTAAATPFAIDDTVPREPADVRPRDRRDLRLAWPPPVEVAPSHPSEPPSAARWCRQEHYLEHDTRPLRTVALKRDRQGRPTRKRVDEDTDGTIDVDIRTTWSRDGRLARERTFHGPEPSCDGEIPGTRFDVGHRYDGFGVWQGERTLVDGQLDGSPRWHLNTYDDAGRPLRSIVHMDGVLLRAVTVRWDARDRVVETIRNNSTTTEYVERWAYDPGGRQRYHATMEAGNWTVVREQLDAQGRVVIEQIDVDGDGAVDRTTTIERDAAGLELTRRTDLNGDGQPDRVVQTTRDALGRPELELTTGPQGTGRRAWSWDEQGRLVRLTSKNDDSWVEDLEVHVFDGQGLEVERTIERHRSVDTASDVANYVDRQHWEREYDTQGRLVRELRLQGELGPNERIEYIYDCRQPYRVYPRRNPLDDPDTAPECLELMFE